ncbi:DsbA family protein [Kitasatospora sp. NPDC004240]
MRLIYVYDAYCGWSYGFARTLADFTTRHPELPLEVVSGGLFTGDRRVPIRAFGHVRGANAAITELTGAEFGEGYLRLTADGSFVMDSEAAARGTAALLAAAGSPADPARSAAGLLARLQEAFYLDGLSLSDPATYRKVAEQAGLDADAVVAALSAPGTTAAARTDFHRSRELGVESFPTLLLDDGSGRCSVLATGHATVAQLEARLVAAGGDH